MKKTLWLVPALLLAGCRSEQVAFQFRPAATSAVAAPVAAAPASPAEAPRPAAGLENEVTIVAPTRPGRLPHHRPVALVPAPVAAPGAPAPVPAVVRHLAQRLVRRHPTEGRAESGLGNIGLFFIGVVLAVLAGLAAIVNVIFSVGFFTALGYVAAGLVVLFLLYSLLSGGGKKKAAKPAR